MEEGERSGIGTVREAVEEEMVDDEEEEDVVVGVVVGVESSVRNKD